MLGTMARPRCNPDDVAEGLRLLERDGPEAAVKRAGVSLRTLQRRRAELAASRRPGAAGGAPSASPGAPRPRRGGDVVELVADPLVVRILEHRNAAALTELRAGLEVFEAATLAAWTARLAARGAPPPSAEAVQALRLARVARHIAGGTAEAVEVLLLAAAALAGPGAAVEA